MDPKSTPPIQPDDQFAKPGGTDSGESRQVSVDIHGALSSDNSQPPAPAPGPSAGPSFPEGVAGSQNAAAPSPSMPPTAAPVPSVPTAGQAPGMSGMPPSPTPPPAGMPTGPAPGQPATPPLFPPDNPAMPHAAHPANSQLRRMMLGVGALLIILVVAVISAYVMVG